MNYDTKNDSICLVWGKRFYGLGVIIHFDEPWAHREKAFVFEIKLPFIKFWWIRYKKKKP